MLPPLLVEQTKIPLKWRYLSLPGKEILAACDDRIALAIVQRLQRLDALMPAILPERFTGGAAQPEMLILVDEKAGQEAMADIVRKDGARFRFMPNLRLTESDGWAVFALVTGASSAQFVYARDRIVALLESRIPRLPDWFIEGMARFYEETQFSEREINVRLAAWTSPAESAALQREPDRPRILLPMEELFARRAAEPGAAGDLDAVWRAQASLFVRWALAEDNGAARDALWQFLDRLEREPPSEALFRELFGMGYADMRDQLSDYLSSATRQPAKVSSPPSTGGAAPRLRFRDATDLEIARIRGEWERLQIHYVRTKSTGLVERYIAQARKTLHRAYDKGERDPRLLASMGLLELDAGDPAAALPLLEAAVAGHVVRPRAYYELARLRYAALTKEIGPAAKLSPSQVDAVLTPLFAGQHQQPPLLQNWALFSEVVGRSDAPPTAAQLAALHEGALKFPHASDLVARAIYFHLGSGQPAAASVLAEAGLRHAHDPATRAKFERAIASFGRTKTPADR